AAALDAELVRLAPARRARGVPVRRQQLHADILSRKVIRGVVRDLPYELEALRVGDELAAEVRAHPFGTVLDMNTVSGLRHRNLQLQVSDHHYCTRKANADALEHESNRRLRVVITSAGRYVVTPSCESPPK